MWTGTMEQLLFLAYTLIPNFIRIHKMVLLEVLERRQT
jgi:hypothetical protein